MRAGPPDRAGSGRSDLPLWALAVRDVHDPQAALVVRLVHQVAPDVEIVVRGAGLASDRAGQDGVGQVPQIPHEGSRIPLTGRLVHFVVQVEELVLLVHPSLVGIPHAGIGRHGDGERPTLVRHIDDGHRGLVGAHTDLASPVVGVGPAVDDG